MQAYKIFDFGSLRFSKSELANIPKHHFGFMVASSLAANDQALFLKLFIMSMSTNHKDAILTDYSAVQFGVIQRNFIAKTYEFMRLIDKFNQRVLASEDQDFIPFMKMATKKIRNARKGETWNLVEKIRNKMTHHYDLDHLDPLESAKGFPDNHSFKMHMHEEIGNSLHIFSEELSYLSELYETEEKGITPSQITDWLLDASRILTGIHQAYMIKSIRLFFPRKKVVHQKLFIQNSSLWQPGDNLPLLHGGRL